MKILTMQLHTNEEPFSHKRAMPAHAAGLEDAVTVSHKDAVIVSHKDAVIISQSQGR